MAASSPPHPSASASASGAPSCLRLRGGRPPHLPLHPPRPRAPAPPTPPGARLRSGVLPPLHQRRRRRGARALVRGSRRAGALPRPPLRRLHRQRRRLALWPCRPRNRPVRCPSLTPAAGLRHHGWGRINSFTKEAVAKNVDDTYRKMQIQCTPDLATRSHSGSDLNHFRPKEEANDSFQAETKVRCLCGSTILNDNVIECEDD